MFNKNNCKKESYIWEWEGEKRTTVLWICTMLGTGLSLSYIISFSPYNKPMRKVIFPAFKIEESGVLQH